MNGRQNKRCFEMQRKLAARFNLADQTVNEAIAALMESIRGRLPLGVEVCLASWMPDSRQLVGLSKSRGLTSEPLSPEEIKRRVVDAGVPDRYSRAFIAEVFAFIETRLGKPLVSAIRRRIPEIEAFEMERVAQSAPPGS